MNYTSTLAEVIQSAINECIGYGRGEVTSQDGEITACAEWAENENDVEVAVKQAGVLRLSYTERGVADKIY